MEHMLMLRQLQRVKDGKVLFIDGVQKESNINLEKLLENSVH